MHTVYYTSSKNQDPYESAVLAEFNSSVDAVQFALALHQASNVPHTIEVLCKKGTEVITECLLSSEKEDK